jgi:hypothetical protein
MSEAQILNLDELIQTPRIIQLTEKTTGIKREINVTDVPSGVVLELIKRESDLKTKAKSEDESLFDWMIDIAIKICQPSFPEISVEWITGNMNFNQLQQFLSFVLEPLNKYIQGAIDEAKKTMAAKSKKTQTSNAPQRKRKS